MNFSAWDPKITTLPGLYLVSAVLMGPFELCTVYWLRITNLIASVVNLYLFCILCNVEENSPNPKKPLSLFALLSGINLAILPPLYFFSHVYYTDTLSITFVLLTVILAKYNRHVLAALTGAFSIIMRQTNIVWVAMVFGQNVLDIFIQITSSKKQRSKRKYVNGSDLYNSIRTVLKNGFPFIKMTGEYYTLICSYTIVILAFLLFIYVNGSIVVGDKSAHEATIHVPQLFYFSLFCAFFTLPHICQDIIPFMK
ncbi:ALG10 alpha-12-glucosyltransferase [Carabus blaptoides fortunei]